MSALRRLLSIATLVAATIGSSARAAEPQLPRDGWVSWDVSVGDAPAWCCFGDRDGRDRDGLAGACKLDGHNNGFGTRHDARTDTITVYARATAGQLDRLRVLSATCPVETKMPVAEQTVTADESTRWLVAQAKGDQSDNRGSLADDALAALSMHRGDVARDAIITLGNTDPRTHIRSQAWFWLAMSGAKGSEAPISAAMRKDPDGGVREQAVFALSRLPDERATMALIAAAKDQTLSRDQRKRAMFWLAQSESPAALAFLDEVLAVR
jgi:hypothetical protein